MAGALRDGALRYRQKGSNSVQNYSWNSVIEDGQYFSKGVQRRLLKSTFFLYILILYLFIICVVHHCDKLLPEAHTSEAATENELRFVAQRAKGLMLELVALGSRPVGSYENEVLAVDIILRQLRFIQAKAKPIHRIELDLHKPNGSFYLDFIDGFTSAYRGVKNIIVKFAPREPTQRSLLVNCHYDSFPTSPGASDDAVNCAIMLEVLQVLAQRSQPLKYSVVFLFNGAEENILQASHGFITQHAWAKDLIAFVNLEACGAGGKELLFQASPTHPWLVRSYTEGAKWPFGSIIAEEVFQGGLVPSDTDFRIFRDYGHLPGLDFAFTKNGYVYHTKYDDREAIPDGSIQHAGDNLLGLILKILDAPEFEKDLKTSSPRMVYFDFLGLFMVTYSVHTGNIISKISIIITLLSIIWRMKAESYNSGASLMKLVWNRGKALLLILGAFLVGIVSSAFVAAIFCAAGSTMAWYHKPYLILGLYHSSSLAAMLSVHWIVAKRRRRKSEDDWAALETYFDAIHILWVVVILGLTVAGIISVYIPVAFLTITGVTLAICGTKLLTLGRRGFHQKFMSVVIFAHILPLILSLYVSYEVYSAFVPIMGRIGATDNPEMVIAVLSSFLAICNTLYMVPLIHVSRDGLHLIAALVGVFLLTAAVTVSPLGFPYSSEKGKEAPQRILFVNIEREFYSEKQSLVTQDSGIWAVPLDYNGPRTVHQYLSTEPGKVVEEVNCDKHMYCGMPYYFPVVSRLRKSYYLKTFGPKVHTPRKFKLISQKMVSSNVKRIAFQITGPSHMSIVLSPKEGAQLYRWSLTKDPVPVGYMWKGRPTHFAYISQGEDFGPWDMWIEIKVPPSWRSSEAVVDLGFFSHILHGHDMISEEFSLFLRRLPEWIHATPWSSTGSFYIF